MKKDWQDNENESLYLCGDMITDKRFYIKAENFSFAKFGARLNGGYLLTSSLPDIFIDVEPENVNELEYPREDEK